MTDWVTAGLAGSVALFAAAAALESRGRHRRLTDELARQPATPPSLYPRINLEACMCSGACLDACPEHDVIGLGMHDRHRQQLLVETGDAWQVLGEEHGAEGGGVGHG
mgnify:CR=1 FL=1